MLVEVKNLRIEFAFDGRVSVPVRCVSFKVPENGRVALVGESGCGKSLTSLALGGLVDRARITGEIVGRPRIAYVFQNPMQSLDPVMKVGAQIEEGMHGRPSREERRRRVAELLESVGLPADAPLADIPGTVPPPWDWPSGCAFHPRCPKAVPACAEGEPRCRALRNMV